MSSVNISNFIARLQEHQKRVEEAAKLAVFQYGSQVITDARAIVPYDTGNLSSTGGVGAPKKSLPAKLENGVVKIEIGFGAKYAAAVHENLNANHPIGEAKYLETAMRTLAPKFSTFVGNFIAKATET